MNEPYAFFTLTVDLDFLFSLLSLGGELRAINVGDICLRYCRLYMQIASKQETIEFFRNKLSMNLLKLITKKL